MVLSRENSVLVSLFHGRRAALSCSQTTSNLQRASLNSFRNCFDTASARNLAFDFMGKGDA